MSFTTEKNQKGLVTGKFIMIKPSQASFSDIPQFNRNRENWDLAKVEDLGLSIRERGIITPLVGYVDGKSIKIVRGSQRLKIAQALEADGFKRDGNLILLPVTLVDKPESDEEIQTLLLDTVADNTHRYEDDYKTRCQSFQTLRDMGMTLEEIGKQTGFSHTLVDYHLKTCKIKPLFEAIQTGKINAKQAAAFTTKSFMTKDDKGKVVPDLKKINEGLKETIAKANETGGKVREVHVSSNRGTGTKKAASLGTSWLKKILDAPNGVVPTEFVLFLRVYLGMANFDEVIKLAKRNKVDLDWLKEVDFEPKKKAAKKAAKASDKKKENPLVEEEEDSEEDLEE